MKEENFLLFRIRVTQNKSIVLSILNTELPWLWIKISSLSDAFSGPWCPEWEQPSPGQDFACEQSRMPPMLTYTSTKPVLAYNNAIMPIVLQS